MKKFLIQLLSDPKLYQYIVVGGVAGQAHLLAVAGKGCGLEGVAERLGCGGPAPSRHGTDLQVGGRRLSQHAVGEVRNLWAGTDEVTELAVDGGYVDVGAVAVDGEVGEVVVVERGALKGVDVDALAVDEALVVGLVLGAGNECLTDGDEVAGELPEVGAGDVEVDEAALLGRAITLGEGHDVEDGSGGALFLTQLVAVAGAGNMDTEGAAEADGGERGELEPLAKLADGVAAEILGAVAHDAEVTGRLSELKQELWKDGAVRVKNSARSSERMLAK